MAGQNARKLTAAAALAMGLGVADKSEASTISPNEVFKLDITIDQVSGFISPSFRGSTISCLSAPGFSLVQNNISATSSSFTGDGPLECELDGNTVATIEALRFDSINRDVGPDVLTIGAISSQNDIFGPNARLEGLIAGRPLPFLDDPEPGESILNGLLLNGQWAGPNGPATVDIATQIILRSMGGGNNNGGDNDSVNPVPLPAGVLLLLTALGSFAFFRRRQIAARGSAALLAFSVASSPAGLIGAENSSPTLSAMHSGSVVVAVDVDAPDELVREVAESQYHSAPALAAA